MNDEHRGWHPVATATDLGAGPLAATLFGAELVLWRDEAGTPHALADRCPHRGTRLSL
ncbi:Rieske (2Fe-2S) protein, partial [Methylibium sp. T29]